jgi:DNA-binding transcriptional regulator YiaG
MTLRALQTRVGWSVVETARRLAVPHVTLKSWLSGRSDPPEWVVRYLGDVARAIERVKINRAP